MGRGGEVQRSESPPAAPVDPRAPSDKPDARLAVRGGDDHGTALPDGTIEKARARGYGNVLPSGAAARETFRSVALLFALLSFFATPPGAWTFALVVRACAGLGAFEAPAAFARTWPLAAFACGSASTALLSIGTFVPFARWHDRLYERTVRRCQPTAEHDISGLWRRSEVRLACLSLAIAAAISTAVLVAHANDVGGAKFYDGPIEDAAGWAYLLFSTVAYFLWIDAWAYVAHRALHLPQLYRAVHKWHHAYKQPTAFSALGLHPGDMLLVQGGVYSFFYVLPMHPACVALNLLYVHYHNVLDHSGVYHESPLPWQPSSLYHDDHHRLFHVNYGQTLTLWDRLGRTFYEPHRKYTETSFSW